MRVSTPSIRLRILKEERGDAKPLAIFLGFNPFDPFEDTESVVQRRLPIQRRRFNPFDPFEDTERPPDAADPADSSGFNPFDPFEDTERR